MRTLRLDGKLEKLVPVMSRYKWTLLGFCKMRIRGFTQTVIGEGHRVCEKTEKYEEGGGFLVHQDMAKVVMDCHPA